MAQLQEMLKQDPSDQFLQYALALEHARMEEYPKAIEIIEGIISNDPQYLGAYYQLGQFYEKTGRANEAISAYKNGINVARQQNNRKTMGELSSALLLLEDEEA
jgi:tetratricopeptide (TPR) repeat protein